MTTVTSPPPTKHIPEWSMADRMRKARTDAGMTAQEIAERHRGGHGVARTAAAGGVVRSY